MSGLSLVLCGQRGASPRGDALQHFAQCNGINSSTRVVSTRDSEASRVSSPKAKHRLAREGGLLSVEESKAAGSMESDVVRGHLERQL